MSLASWQFVLLSLVGWIAVRAFGAGSRPYVLVLLSAAAIAPAGPSTVAGAGAILVVTVMFVRFGHRLSPRLATIALAVVVSALVVVVMWPKVRVIDLADPLNLSGFSGSIGFVGASGLFSLTYLSMQAMAVVVESWRDPRVSEAGVLETVNTVAFFSHSNAGPLVRPAAFVRELRQPGVPTSDDAFAGFELMLIGAVKKIAFADPYMTIARSARGAPLILQLALFAVAPIAVYFDASGYIDIARGAARCVGVTLPKAFARPLTKTRSPSEFWRRWQTHLMGWFRTYVYHPIRNKTGSAAFAIMVTFVCAALWHGVSVLWLVVGAVNPLLFYVERRSTGWQHGHAVRVSLVWLQFAAFAFSVGMATFWRTVENASALVEQAPASLDVAVLCCLMTCAMWLTDLDDRSRQRFGDRRPMTYARAGVLAIAILLLVLNSGGPASRFVYQGF